MAWYGMVLHGLGQWESERKAKGVLVLYSQSLLVRWEVVVVVVVVFVESWF